jgi:mannose-6-phosphate isomerase
VTQSLYPLRFKEILRDYEFGGRWIPEAFDKPGLPEDGVIAETWEVSCRPGDISEVTNGPLAGKNLQELIDESGADLLGTETVERSGTRFPLLVKFLDATHTLGEQAHPDDEMAARFGYDDPGKTEAWYMVRVKPGASIRIGNRPGVTAKDVSASMIDGTAAELMPEEPLAASDTFLLYGGTMHYSKGGMLLYEIVQNSGAHINLKKFYDDIPEEDKPYLMHRAESCVHLEDGADFRTQHVELTEGANTRTFLFASRYFAVEKLALAEPYTVSCDGTRLYVITQIEGAAKVRSGDREEILKPGNTTLLPACLGDVELAPDRESTLLKAYVPDLRRDVVDFLRSRGVDDERILRLGGRTELNHLKEVI